MTIFVVGINHKTAPVDLRERVAFSPEQQHAALQQLQVAQTVQEVVIVSTCNRTELYCSGENANAQALLAWLGQFHHLQDEHLHEHIYVHYEQQAVQHLMRVACGLDSLVLGEPQILGQVKQAFSLAKDVGTISSLFDRLFQQTFAVAKQVRTDTDIGASAVSVAFAAVSLAKHIFGSLEQYQVLLVGAGETIELVARHLKEQGCQKMTVANRTVARAEALAAEMGASVLTLAQVPEYLAKADIVISSTASTLPIIGKGMVEQALKKRRYKPMFLVDLAVPRDIEGQVADLDDAYLYTVDDLQAIVAKNVQSRQHAAEQAEHMVLGKTDEFAKWLRSLDAVDVIREYRVQCEDAKNDLLQRALAQLQSGKEAEQVLVELANKLTNRMMHAPTQAIREAAQTGAIDKLAVIKQALLSND